MSQGLPDDWQAKVKRVFVIPMMLIDLAVIVIGVIAGWWGAVVAGAGIFVVFALIGSARFRSVSAAPGVVIAVVGTAWAFTESIGSVVLASISLAVVVTYAVWYSRNGRVPSAALTVGAAFPEITLSDLDGNTVSSRSWLGSATVLVFYRGNWCPLCSVQVQELAAGYREISTLGAKVVLVSPQPAEESKAMAERFDAPMTFLVDEGNVAARTLGIQHPGGAPVGVARDGETVLPTAVVLDEEGVVRLADETENYRFRPHPDLFLTALRRL